MEKTFWKVIGIVFMTMFILENLFFAWILYDAGQDEKETAYCYYDVCEGSYDAYLLDGVCTYYELDVLGEYRIDKEKYIG